jgi:S1-C subfamily serine protease
LIPGAARRASLAVLFGAALLAVSTPVASGSGLEDGAARRIAAVVGDAIVHVDGRRAFRRLGLPMVGVAVGDGSVVLTFLRGGTRGDLASVLLPGGERRRARIAARDAETGIAALRLERPLPNGLALRGPPLEPGEPVLTAGYPFGTKRGDARPAMGQGVAAQVSRGGAVPRILLTIAVNPGEYGGALVDGQGRLAGLLHWERDPTTGLSSAISVARPREAFAEVADLSGVLAPAPPEREEAWPVHDRLRQVAEAIRPNVVSILVNPEEGGEADRTVTGLLIDGEGHVLTTRANVREAKRLTVIPPGRPAREGKLLGSDERLGIALLSIPPVSGDGAGVEFAGSVPPVGTFVVAVGNPNGRGADATMLVSMGIVGATNRRDRQYGALHTDAAVNRGNLGGPLLDLEGRVVGLLSSLGGDSLRRLGTNSGLGFAIPAPAFLSRLDSLKRGETLAFRPGYLGVTLSFEEEEGGGVRIDTVIPGRAAARGGVRPGDVIRAVNGKAVEGIEDARRVFTELTEGEKVAIVVRRKGGRVELEVTLDPWPPGIPR